MDLRADGVRVLLLDHGQSAPLELHLQLLLRQQRGAVGGTGGGARPVRAGRGRGERDGHDDGPAGLPTASYGIGTPGCNGAHHICGNSAPAIGNANFKLTCSNAPATSLGLCLVANAQDVSGSDPFQLGILLHLDLVLATDLQAMDFNSDAAGLGTANAPIPNNPNLVGNH